MIKRLNSSINIFIAIGVINTCLHTFILVGLVELLKINVIVSNTVAFFIANIFSYFANSHYTFKNKYSIKKYLKFVSSSILLLLLSNFIFLIADFLDIHYYYALVFNIIIIPSFSYLIMKFIIFNKDRNV